MKDDDFASIMKEIEKGVKTHKKSLQVDFDTIDPIFERGFTTMLNYWGSLDDDAEYDNDDGLELGVVQIYEDANKYYGQTAEDSRESFITSIDSVMNAVFEKCGYNQSYGFRILYKMSECFYTNNYSGLYFLKLLNAFDVVSCCISDFDVYPRPLVECLGILCRLLDYDETPIDLYRTITYVLSIYNVPNEYDSDLAKDNKFNPEDFGLMTMEERNHKKMKNFQPTFCKDSIEDIELDSIIMGCSVKVKFDKKVFKYNCRSGNVSEGDFVKVSGKMSNAIGVVTDFSFVWCMEDFMEEVIAVKNEDGIFEDII